MLRTVADTVFQDRVERMYTDLTAKEDRIHGVTFVLDVDLRYLLGAADVVQQECRFVEAVENMRHASQYGRQRHICGEAGQQLHPHLHVREEVLLPIALISRHPIERVRTDV